jgi:HK97 gp10 family phage protein
VSATLTSRFPAIVDHAERRVGPTNETTARRIAAAASTSAPRRTGALAGGIQARPGEGDDWTVVVPASYASLVEFGTRHAGAEPFLVPAAEANRAQHVRDLQEMYQ